MLQQKTNNYVHLAHFRDDLIILHLTENRFLLMPDMPVERINSFLASSESTDSALTEAFLSQGINSENIPFSTALSSVKNTGLLETRWKAPTINAVKHSTRLLCSSIFALIRAGLMIKIGGYKHIVKALSRDTQHITPNPRASSDTARVMAHINKAFILDFSNNRCLTYALTLCLMCRRMGISARLIVGVRTRPFFSHAWVELDGIIINDDPELRKKLSIILEA